MTGSPERREGILPPPERNSRKRKEVPQFSLIEEICHGVEVVQMETGERRYHIVWEKDNLPAHSFFGTIQPVLNQHERVIERYLGTEIPSAAKGLLRLAGESQKMGELGLRLSNLGRGYLTLLGTQEPRVLQEEIAAIRGEIGRVTNPPKRKAQAELRSALLSPQSQGQIDSVLVAALAILARNSECLAIIQGTLGRFRRVYRQRNLWEGMVERSVRELASGLVKLEEGGLAVREKEQIARHISGARYGVFVRLQSISGPEYWARIQTRDVQNLARFGDFLRQGDEARAKRILIQAILKLERVVQEKQEREKTKVEK